MKQLNKLYLELYRKADECLEVVKEIVKEKYNNFVNISEESLEIWGIVLDKNELMHEEAILALQVIDNELYAFFQPWPESTENTDIDFFEDEVQEQWHLISRYSPDVYFVQTIANISEVFSTPDFHDEKS